MEVLSESRPRVGRPPALSHEEREKQILAAAEATFLDAGYGAATMEEIAKRAGMSKKTLYQYFNDKAAVFEAMIRAMPVLPDLPLPQTVAADDLEEVLTAGLLHFGSFILSPQQVAITRLVVAETLRHPEVTRLFADVCIERGRRQITGFIAHLQSRGLLANSVDPGSLSDVLYGATIATVHFDHLMNAATHPFGNARIRGLEALEETIRERLRILFHGVLKS